MSEIVAIELGAQERALVENYVETGDWVSSADLSGFSKSDCKKVAKAASQSPAILAAVHVEIGKRLVAGAAVGFRVLMDIAQTDQDTAQGKKLQLEAAKELLKLGGHVGPRAKSPEGSGAKSLHEMSVDELRRQKDALETAIADRAKGVNASPNMQQDSQAIDLLE